MLVKMKLQNLLIGIYPVCSDLGKQQLQLDELHEQNDVYLEQIKALKEEMLLIMQMSEQAKAFLMRDPVNRPVSAK